MKPGKERRYLIAAATVFIVLFLLFFVPGLLFHNQLPWGIKPVLWQGEYNLIENAGSGIHSNAHNQLIKRTVNDPDFNRFPVMLINPDSASITQNTDSAFFALLNIGGNTSEKPISGAPLETDSTIKERVLLLGDSQAGGLRQPIYNYCYANDHQLVATVAWSSSTTKQWSQCDTIEYYIREFNPTSVIVAIGLNEVFNGDRETRKKYISIINEKIAAYHLPCFWLAPASWVKDKGITDAIAEVNGDYYYDAQHLVLGRAGDGRHPDEAGYNTWIDSAAVKMTQSSFIDFSRTGKYGSPGRDSKIVFLDKKKN